MAANGFCIPFHLLISTGLVCKWQLESLGNVINIKNHQIMQLKMVEFDAKNSRMGAKKELDEVGEAFDRSSPGFASACT